MASAKPPKPPVFDAKAANDAWKNLKRPDGTPYSVFANGSFVKQVEWERKVGYEIQNANAEYIDEIKSDLDSFRENNGVAHNSFNQRIAALEAQAAHPPFPG